jgi:hypothetical protein
LSEAPRQIDAPAGKNIKLLDDDCVARLDILVSWPKQCLNIFAALDPYHTIAPGSAERSLLV